MEGIQALPPVSSHLFHLLLRKVHMVTLLQHTSAGLVVHFHNISNTNENLVYGLVMWSIFPTIVRGLSSEDKILLAIKRIPVGSIFNVSCE